MASVCPGDPLVATDAWVMDSVWAATRAAVLPRTGLIVALDLPRHVSLRRLVVRTLSRLRTREPICGENVETLRSVFSRDSILVWHFRSFRDKRAEMTQWEADPALPPVLRLTSARDVARWLAAQRPR